MESLNSLIDMIFEKASSDAIMNLQNWRIKERIVSSFLTFFLFFYFIWSFYNLYTPKLQWIEIEKEERNDMIFEFFDKIYKILLKS